MNQWTLICKKDDFNKIAYDHNVDPVVARLMVNRNVDDYAKYLHGCHNDFYNPFLLKDMDKCVSILKRKIEERKRIRIIGDYDVDGTTATAILYRGFSALGANVDFQIPHRIVDGYGLNISIIEKAEADRIDTIVTCDNGIAAYEQIEYAKKHGITVIITDHHEVPYIEDEKGKCYIMPPANAVIDPKRPDDPYPFKEICGAFIALKLIQALTGSLDEELVALASVGTICDVMPLIGENRYLVKEGLNKLKLNIGLCALIKANGLEGKKISSYHIGFVIGPCINATGRLDSAARAVNLLCTQDEEKAQSMAEELVEYNKERKDLTEQGIEEAVLQIESRPSIDKVLVLTVNCHESIAGIIAGRIREKYCRPAIVLTKTEKGYKGSGRSIDDYNMFEELNRHRDLMEQFGGHKLAAGLSVTEQNLPMLKKALNDSCSLCEYNFHEKIRIDVDLPLSYVTEDLIEQFSLLEPFGAGNPKPVFAYRNITFLSGQKIGKEKNVGKYRISDGQHIYIGLLFSRLDEFDTLLDEKYGTERRENLYRSGEELQVSIIYYPDVNEFRGEKSIQYIIQDFC